MCGEGKQMINDAFTKYVIMSENEAGSISFTFKKEKSYVLTLLAIIPWMVQCNKYFSSNYTAQDSKEELSVQGKVAQPQCLGWRREARCAVVRAGCGGTHF